MKRAKIILLIIILLAIFVTTILLSSSNTFNTSFNVYWRGKKVCYPRHLRHKYIVILHFKIKNLGKDIIITLREVMINWDKVRYAYSSASIISVVFAYSNNILSLNFTDHTKDIYRFNISLSVPLNLTILVINQNTVDKYSVLIDRNFIEKQIKTEKLIAILIILLIFVYVLFIALCCSP